ncbi:monocarboxylate transporter 3 [Trichuris trichiura]|uniref:Monocarboxylate transporter 3 n=1 Tax=Trichuris trichiura TaxID=36087 RepID=A0A077ZJA8_TRITR|nr:monocarboxylate transporter 3 [Trichuris trichiura]
MEKGKLAKETESFISLQVPTEEQQSNNNFPCLHEVFRQVNGSFCLVEVVDLISPAPDGGWGWVVVLSCFLISVIIDGAVFSYGILLPALCEYFNSSVVESAWVGSLFSGVYLLVGIGAGLTYIPAVVFVGYYFERKRAIATGIAMAGSGVGAVVMPPLYAMVIEEYTWRGAMLIFASLFLQCAVLGSLMRPLPIPASISLITTDEKTGKVFPSSGDVDVADTGKDVLGKSGISLLHPLDVVQEEDSLPADESSNRRNALPKLAEEADKWNSLPKLSTSRPQMSRLLSQSGRISAGDYARSISRLASTTSKSNHSAELLKTCISVINPKEFNRPFSRQDILYGGSITQLEDFQRSKENFSIYRSDTICAPNGVDLYETTDGNLVLTPSEGAWKKLARIVPLQMRVVLQEMFSFELMGNLTMVLLAVSNFLGMIGFYVPFVYTAAYAESLGNSHSASNLLLSLLGIANTIGRVFAGWLSDKRWVKALWLSNWSLLACGVLTALFPFCLLYSIMAIYAVLFGFIIAAFVSLTSIILVDELGLQNLTNSFGLLMLFRGVASIIGSPLAGALFDSTGSFFASFIFAGVLIILSGLSGCAVPFMKRFDRSKRRAVVDKESLDPLKLQMDKVLESLCDDAD